jgi:hypothetical protein
VYRGCSTVEITGGLGHLPERKAELLSAFDRHRGNVWADNRHRDEESILSFTICGVANEIGKAGLVCPKAFAVHLMSHQGASPMPNADIAKTLECLQCLSPALWSER